MAEEDGLYLDNLDEFINDEDKIVTYKWLSRTLSVSCNQAKQMLFAFLMKQRKDENNNITATYLVGGRSTVNGQQIHQYVLTSDDDLEDTKTKFEIVTSVHIYSLQKSKPKDSNSLSTVDYDIHQEHKNEINKWSHIYCKEAKKLNDAGASRSVSKNKSNKESTPGVINGFGSSNVDNSKSKSSNQRPKKGQLPNMGMFAVKTEKKTLEKSEEKINSEKNNEVATENKEKSVKASDKSKSSGMLSFFGKQIAAPPKNTSEKKEEVKENLVEKVKEKPKKEVQEKKKIEEKTCSKPKENKRTPENKQQKTNKQTRKRIKNLSSSDEEEEPIPKRLTKLVSDSDSEEDARLKKSKSKIKKDNKNKDDKPSKKRPAKKVEDSKHDETEDMKTKKTRKRKKVAKEESSEEESEKAENTVVIETPIANQPSAGRSMKRRKRRKVMRTKTYMDDDGFMVTEKVYESESTDVSEEEQTETIVKQEAPPRKSPDSKPKKFTEPKSSKQASLMTFFRKN